MRANLSDMQEIHETLFKSKNPKRYIQVKTQIITQGTQILAICSDVTKIKDFEHTQQRMRAMFFSSIAHELRTPLNSIIPIVRMILLNFAAALNPRIINYLQIILNSSLHL